MDYGRIKRMKGRNSYIAALECLGIGLLLMLLCSCVSFNIGDWPSRFAYPHNSPTSNWCGSAGAFCAYYLMYYIGPGVFVILASAICFLIARLALRPAGQPVFRAIGLALVTVAASISFYRLWPFRFFGFPMGSGGVLGIGTAHFLQSHFASLGTLLLLSAIWVVGTLLLADNIILIIAGCFGFVTRKMVGIFVPMWSAHRWQAKGGEVLGEIWQKLRVKPAPRVPHAVTPVFQGKPEPARIEPLRHRPDLSQMGTKVTSPEVRKPDKAYVPPSYENYVLPPLELLAESEYSFSSVQEKVVKAKASALERLLSEFNIHAQVVAAETGPVVTMFELELAAGVKVSQISALANDMARTGRRSCSRGGSFARQTYDRN